MTVSVIREDVKRYGFLIVVVRLLFPLQERPFSHTSILRVTDRPSTTVIPVRRLVGPFDDVSKVTVGETT